jgi:hypothetical protein
VRWAVGDVRWVGWVGNGRGECAVGARVGTVGAVGAVVGGERSDGRWARWWAVGAVMGSGRGG